METKEALFSLNGYQIIHSMLNLEGVSSAERFNLNFTPSGVYKQSSGEYVLYLEFVASSQEKEVIKVKLEAQFTFKDIPGFDNIPIYFYSNCIAIVFPYVRAFVSTLTLQANVRPIIIPTLNIQPLGMILKEHTSLQ